MWVVENFKKREKMIAAPNYYMLYFFNCFMRNAKKFVFFFYLSVLLFTLK